MRNRSLYILFAALAVITIVSRITPHWENFAPVGAFALFAGALFPGRAWAMLPVLGAMLVSDILLHFTRDYTFPHDTTLWVYGAYVAIVAMGYFLRARRPMVAALGTALLGSLLFFVLTNTGSWVMSATGNTPPFTYPAHVGGWLTALEMGWPFYKTTLVADMCYTAVFFGGWAWFSRTRLQASPQAA